MLRVPFSLPTMTSISTTTTTSIFQNGRLKSGIYKIQNIHTDTYLDILQGSKELCCRPARDLEDGRGLVRPTVPILNSPYI